MKGSPENPRHRWSGADEAALAEAVAAVAACESLRGVRFWSAVVGRLLPAIVVSADAAKKRWEVLHARREVMMPEGRDAWTEIEERVEAQEQAREDWIVDTLTDIRDYCDAMRGELQRLREAWE
jgi:hypothetical protein